MKSKMKKINGSSMEFSIEVSKEKVEMVFNEVIEDIRKKASVPGFRPGKAPLDIIQKSYAEDIHDEVKRRLVPEGYQYALNEHEVNPISYPEISDINLGLAGNLTFRAKVDIYPEITLKNYKGLKVTSKKVEVKDTEVDETIERIRNMYSDFIDIDGPIKKGNFGICDVDTFMDGKEIAKKREKMWIEADKDASLLGVGEEIVGLKKGDTKEVEVTLPENYPDKKYAGKKATFKIEIKETKEKKVPELNDELAKKIGKDTMAEVKKEIREQLTQKKETDEKILMKNQIMEQFLKKYSFEAPGSMVERQLKVLMDRATNELLSKGVNQEEIEKHKEKLTDQLAKEAENKVKIYFILDRIANEEKVEVTEADIDIWLQRLSVNYSQPVEEVKKYYTENNLIEGLKEQLREEKTLDFLVDEAVVTVE